MRSLRRAFTLIEIVMVMGLIGIVAGWSITKFRAAGYRMDSNIRMLQNTLIGAQQTAITRNTVVQLQFDASLHRVRILLDADDNGAVDGGEVVSYRPLFDGAKFITPDSTLDGALPYFLTGPGKIEIDATHRAIRIAPNGTLSGDVVVYIGTIVSRKTEMRAMTVVGATARTAFWSRGGGVWRQRSY